MVKTVALILELTQNNECVRLLCSPLAINPKQSNNKSTKCQMLESKECENIN